MRIAHAAMPQNLRPVRWYELHGEAGLSERARAQPASALSKMPGDMHVDSIDGKRRKVLAVDNGQPAFAFASARVLPEWLSAFSGLGLDIASAKPTFNH